jgi:peptidase M48-like protein
MSTFRHQGRLLPILLLTVALGSASAQTHIVAPTPNKYSPADDVKLGQEAAQQVQKELPLLNDASVEEYLAGIGQRLVRVIPGEYQHPEFRYTFRVVNQKEINAFALPGGPMFVNRGMIEAARDEGEIAGVMAHELSHVLLRHGTAQATKATKYEIGAIAGQVLGAIVGGTAGSIIAQGSNFGISTYFMKFSREYESQADILGVQLMARAGYNPQSMANMFRTLASQGGGGGPEWLSDHPNPGNREQRILQEAKLLNATGNPSGNTSEFQRAQARLKGMSPALTAKEIQQQNQRRQPTGTSGRAVDVAPPSGSTYAPQGAYFSGDNGGSAFTHGVEVGVAQGTGDLQRDTNSLLRNFAQSNPDLQQSGRARNESVAGRSGITVDLANVSEVTGQPEYISLSTTELRNGGLLYVIGVAPRTEAGTYQDAFRRIRQNIQVADR